MRRRPTKLRPGLSRRRGVSTLDYALVLGVVMPLALIVVPTGIRMVRAVYEMVVVMISWPFL